MRAGLLYYLYLESNSGTQSHDRDERYLPTEVNHDSQGDSDYLDVEHLRCLFCGDAE
jgi:hypothetical protein